jgi:FkbM family methyltransferase
MNLLSVFRTAIPRSMRTAMLRDRRTHRMLCAFVKRNQLRQHPHCRYSLGFDGHKCLGWALGGLESWERESFAFCSELFRALRPSVVWDVGANCGAWTLWFAGQEHCVTSIYAFEPDPANLSMLRANVSRNELGSLVTIRGVALSSKVGEAVFKSDPFTGSTGSLESGETFVERHYDRSPESLVIRTSTIDAETANGLIPPDFLKIDVEGHEYDLLLGADAVLSMRRPAMLLEAEGRRAEDAIALLREREYRFFCPISRRERTTPSHELAAIPSERVSDLKGVLQGTCG